MRTVETHVEQSPLRRQILKSIANINDFESEPSFLSLRASHVVMLRTRTETIPVVF